MCVSACVTWSLGLVGDDTADKVRLSAAQVGHQLVQVFLPGDGEAAVTTHD